MAGYPAIWNRSFRLGSRGLLAGSVNAIMKLSPWILISGQQDWLRSALLQLRKAKVGVLDKQKQVENSSSPGS